MDTTHIWVVIAERYDIVRDKTLKRVIGAYLTRAQAVTAKRQYPYMDDVIIHRATLAKRRALKAKNP